MENYRGRTMSSRLLSCFFMLLLGSNYLVAQALPDTINLQWERHPSALVTSSLDAATDVVVDQYGNLYVTGKSEGLESGYDYLTMKYSNAGILQWSARYDGPDHANDIPNALAVDAGGNVYLTGMSVGSYPTGVDVVTLKYNSAGDLQWNQRYSTPENCNPSWYCDYMTDAGMDIAIDQAGNVYVAGVRTMEPSQRDMLTIKYTPDGYQAWTRTYDGPYHGHDEAIAIVVDPAGDILVAGISADSTYYDPQSYAECVTLKYGQSGDVLWEQRFSLNDSLSATPVGIALHPDGSLYVTGNISGAYRYGTGFAERCDIFTMKYSPTGILDWVDVFNTTVIPDYLQAEIFDVARSIAVDGDGNAYITGVSRKRDPDYGMAGDSLITLKYSDDGTHRWVVYQDKGSSDAVQSAGITVDETGNVYVAGTQGVSNGVKFIGESLALLHYNTLGQLQWTRQYGASDDTLRLATGVACDEYGNVYVIGERGVADESDLTTLKYTTSGTHSATLTVDGPGSSMGFVSDAKLDADDNIYVVGATVGMGMNQDFITTKIDREGNTVWTATYDGPEHLSDNALVVDIDQWENVYVAGLSMSTTGPATAIVKYDASGNQLWISRLDDFYPHVIQADVSGNVYLGGAGLVKYAPDGTLIWHADPDRSMLGFAVDDSGHVYATDGDSLKKFNGLGEVLWSQPMYCTSVATNGLENIYVSGPNWHGDFTKKLTADGTQLWSVDVGGDRIVIYDSSTVYVGDGYYNGVHKLTTGGTILWSRGVNSDHRERFDVDREGNVYAVGTSNDGTGLHGIRYNSDGSTEWTIQKEEGHKAVGVRVDSSMNFFLINEREEMDFSRTPIVEKYIQSPFVTSVRDEQTMPGQFRLEQNYPNPFNPTTRIGYQLQAETFVELKVFDILGREVTTLTREVQKAGNHRATFDARNLASGIYFYRLKAGGFVETKRMMLIR